MPDATLYPDLHSKSVVVTGAANGLGRAVVDQLVANGSRITAVDRDAEGLDRLRDVPGVTVLHLDVASPGAAENVASAAGQTDVLINNAGILDGLNLIDEVTHEGWDEVIAINLSAPFHLCRLFVPGMLAQGSGAIVNVASVAGLRGGHGGTAYTASKWGLIGLTQNIAASMAHRGLRANAICPGGMDTSIGSPGPLSEQGRAFLGRDAGAPTPTSPAEVAEVVVFLSSTASNRINGASVVVDGAAISF